MRLSHYFIIFFMTTAIGIIFLAAALTFLALRFGRDDPLQNGAGVYVFPPLTWLRLVLVSGACTLIACGVSAIIFDAANQRIYAIASIILGVLVALFMPRSIHVNPSGVAQRNWIGRLQQYTWSQLDSASEVPSTGQVQIHTQRRVVITHAPWHRGRGEFIDALKQHIKVYQQ